MTSAQKPLRYIQIGVGGHGQHWCTIVMPHLKKLGLAIPVAAVDINPDMLGQAKQQFYRKRPVVTLPGCNSTASARLAC